MPKEIVEYPDYTFDEHFGKQIPSFFPRCVLEDFVKGRAEKAGLKKYVKFNRPVQRISFDQQKEEFYLVSRDNLTR